MNAEKKESGNDLIQQDPRLHIVALKTYKKGKRRHNGNFYRFGVQRYAKLALAGVKSGYTGGMLTGQLTSESTAKK